MFAGNLWETNHPTTGEALEIVTYTHDLPWLGNPHKPDDGNNPGWHERHGSGALGTHRTRNVDRP